MRWLGYRTVDMLVDRITGPPGPVVRTADPAELRERLTGPPPETPEPFEAILDGLERDVLPFVARISHPGYLAFIPGEGTWPGALGDLIASALNMDTCWWLGASGPSMLELVVVDWLRTWVGYPEQAAGVLVSGGSAANLTALACAREARIGPMTQGVVVYMSDQTHSSLARATRALGFRPDQVRIIPTDEEARIRPDALRGAIAADGTGGRKPLVLIANGGTTATGAVDPFPELAAVCSEHGIWLHVDGAYGAFACLSERGRRTLAGIEFADSITLDPHKWLYQPVELGALLVRDGELLRRGFEISPDFLSDVESVNQEVNFSDLGLQLTRSCRALKLWISLRYFGVAAFRKAIDTCLDLSLHAERQIAASTELELMSAASLGIVSFRRHPAGVENEVELDRINASLAEQIQAQETSSCPRLGCEAASSCVSASSTTRPRRRTSIARWSWLDAAGGRCADGARHAGEVSRDRPRLVAAPGTRCRGVAVVGAVRVARRHGGAAGSAHRARAPCRGRRDDRGAVAGEPRALRRPRGPRGGHRGRQGRELDQGRWVLRRAGCDRLGRGFRTHSRGDRDRDPTRLLVLDWMLVNRLMNADPAFGEQLERASRERLARL
jgi:aromatic-L-amino-acid/L-tryptophan decarboxylase